MSTTTEQGSAQVGNARAPATTRPRPAENAEAVVRELIIELARVEYALRYSSASIREAAALAGREREVVAALRSRRLPVTCLDASVERERGPL